MGKYTLIRDISGCLTDGNIFALPTEDIKRGFLADIYDQYGQKWGIKKSPLFLYSNFE